MSKIPDDILSVPKEDQSATKSILIMTADKTEDLEFFYPYYRFIEEGYTVHVVTPEGGAFKGKTGYEFQKTAKIADVSADDYDLLYIPGGKAPEELKKSEEAIALTQSFKKQGKIISSICHGPQLLAKADIIRDVRISAYPEVEGELNEAGAVFVADKTVVDGQFITARWPADLPFHLQATLEALK